jgi:hypothetical protein
MRPAPSTNGRRIIKVKEKRPPEGGRSICQTPKLLTFALDDDLAVTIVIAVVVATSPDHNGIVTVAIFTLADHFTVPIAIAMTATHGDANAGGANTDTDFFRTRRHCNGNAGQRDGSYYKTLDHRMLLSMNLSGKQFAGL